MSDIAELYQGLDVGIESNNIRVLDLLPGFWHSELRVEIRVVNLALDSYFEALSYPCGSSSEGKTLIANDGCRLPIYNNLYLALRRLRYRFARRTLWVDAICINQADDVEKGHQVASMDIIYRTANKVNIWLGELDSDFPFDLRMLYQPWMLIPSPQVMFIFKPDDMWRVFRNHPLAMDKAIANTTPRWQDRAWTMQEFIVAQRLQFSYGGRTAEYDMDSLRYVQTQAWDNLPSLKSFIDHIGMVMTHLKDHYNNSPKMGYKSSDENTLGIIDCVQALAGQQARDPRDKVYSIRGIISVREKALIKPDYTITIASAFANATHVCMVVRNDIEILRLVTIANRRTDGLRSWMVDFVDLDRMLDGVNLANIHLFKTPALALEDHYSDWEVIYNKSAETLTLLGYACDKVVNFLPFEPQTCRLKFERDGFPSPELLLQMIDFSQRAATAVGRALSDDMVKLSGLHLLRQRTKRESEGRGLRSKKIWDTLKDDASPKDLESISFNNSYHECLPDILIDLLDIWSVSIGGGRIPNEDRPYYPLPQLRWDVKSFANHAYNAAGGYCLFSTSSGLIGIAPSPLEDGDILVLVRSLSPFLILRQQSESIYEFCGLAFVHEFMDCAPWELVKAAGASLEQFVIQ
jgi:hypothetical protein